MSNRKSASSSGAMLDLWRPPQDAGEPIGCLATTYTFAPGLFDEQCLARFLDIDSEPNREDLAFLLEREDRLGRVYAGVLVDHSQAGVEHSLRWDVLPVRVPSAKQHAKLSLLVWQRHVRIIVASANLTEPGYRYNFEVAGAVDCAPAACDAGIVADALAFLRRLIPLVPGASSAVPEVARASEFLNLVGRHVAEWAPAPRRQSTRQHLLFTMPGVAGGPPASSLEQAFELCRGRWGSPSEVSVASPFFDVDGDRSRATATTCKMMARGARRTIAFAVPAILSEDKDAVPRLLAPKGLILTPPAYQCAVSVGILPEVEDKNHRAWHAKMLELRTDKLFTALMVGSSNFTCAGLGVGSHRNAEANLLTTVEHADFGREVGALRDVWPELDFVDDPDSAEWLGVREEPGEPTTPSQPWPPGFVAATYRAGDAPVVLVRVESKDLPEEWSVHACGRAGVVLLTAEAWRALGSPSVVECRWTSPEPPEKLLIRWDEQQAILPLNVEDGRALPPPPKLDRMTADDMLGIVAASDPSAAYRAWAKQNADPGGGDDDDLDSATPPDLDPLRRFDLQATFLHKVRRRARVLEGLRQYLQTPVLTNRALEWRLRGLVGVEAIADRFVQECLDANGTGDEALLTLADFLIVLKEVKYEPGEGSLTRAEFSKVFGPFLVGLTAKLDAQIESLRERLSKDVMAFWKRVVERCRE